jgi:hypothetical protein
MRGRIAEKVIVEGKFCSKSESGICLPLAGGVAGEKACTQR